MFTGIIEETGSIGKIDKLSDGARLEVKSRTVIEGAKIGDSIAVNGVCLTVVDQGNGWFAADVSAETIQRTSLKAVQAGTAVNLERPLTPSSRMGGHIVQGHVDGTGEFIEARPSGDGWIVRIGFQPELARYIVEKGSIAVDGISLTVASLAEKWFEIAIIPHTWRATNLSGLARGTPVNIEVDVVAKYVERMVRAYTEDTGKKLTVDRLKELGY